MTNSDRDQAHRRRAALLTAIVLGTMMGVTVFEVARTARAARIVRSTAEFSASTTSNTVAPAGADPAAGAAGPWPAADLLFHRDPRWLGSDAALTIPLGYDRTLWLFGDTFVATAQPPTRSESVMVSNSVAVQLGIDPGAAGMEFAWRTAPDGSPAAFFPHAPGHGYWPGHGLRVEGGPLVLFLYSVIYTPGKGLGFEGDGNAICVIDDPDAPVREWEPRITPLPALPFDALPATAVVEEGGSVIALAIRQKGAHAGTFVRYPVGDFARGDLSRAEWWAGSDRGWVPQAELGPEGPVFVIDDAGSECSIHRDPALGYVHVASSGFGATDISMRTAPAITGPWSAPRVIYRPPESDGAKPFVYAAKAHPELVRGAVGDLLVTYATNSFDFKDLVSPEGSQHLYWPRVVRVRPSPTPPDSAEP